MIPPDGQRRIHAVNAFDIQQCGKFFALIAEPGIAVQNIAGFQPEFPDLGIGYVDVLVARHVIVRTYEAVSLRHNLENAVRRDSAVHCLQIRMAAGSSSALVLLECTAVGFPNG